MPEVRRRLPEELLGVTLLPHPPAVWGAPAAALPPKKELMVLQRSQHPPLPPPLPQLHLLPLLGRPPAMSSHCPPCKRRERVRSQMNPYRRTAFKKRFLPSFDYTPPRVQSCCLGGGIRPTCSPPRQSALSEQDELVYTKLLKLVVQDIFFTLMTVSIFSLLRISGAFLCLLTCR